MVTGLAEKRAPETLSQALPISPPSESTRSLKRVREATPTHEGNPENGHEAKKSRSRRPDGHATRDLTSDLPIVMVPAELLDTNSSELCRFSPGAIIMMRLVDFQVSHDATYQFEPHLNMIMGSNGSGKSTVVTAIFLLFQGKFRDLKQPSYGDFVTYGKKRAVISAAIRANRCACHVVALVISSASGAGAQAQPQWYIDGVPVNNDQFAAFVTSYHIQVNNLSQFLPQSRIANFAGLSGEDRLKSIEEAVGYDGMIDDHKLLADRGEELAETERDIDLYTKRLEDLRERQGELEGKVGQLSSMHKEKGHLDYLHRVVRLAEYRAVKGELSHIRDALDSAREQLRNFDSEHLFVLEELEKVSEQLASLDAVSRHQEAGLRDVESTLKQSQSYNQGVRADLQAQIRIIKEVKRERDGYDNKSELIEKELRDLSEQLSHDRRELDKMGDTNIFNQKKNELEVLNKRYQEKSNRIRVISQDLEENRKLIDKFTLRLERANIQLANLENSQNEEQLLRAIQNAVKWDGGMLRRAVYFVRKHSHRFKLPVIEPAILSVNLVDRRFAPMIASALQVSHVFKFVCQCREDMALLTDLASKEDGIDIKAVLLTGAPMELPDAAFRALKDAGFQGVLSDGLSGPKPVVDYLKSLGLSSTPYTFSSSLDSSRKQLKEMFPLFKAFVDDKTKYTFSRSYYGRHLETEASEPISVKPWALTMLRRDTTAEKRSLADEIKSAFSEKTNLSERNTSLEDSLAIARGEDRSMRENVVNLSSTVMKFQSIQKRHHERQARYQDLKRILSDLKAKRAQQAVESVTLVNNLMGAIASLCKKDLQYNQLLPILRTTHGDSMSRARRQDLVNKRDCLLSALQAKRKSCASLVTEYESKLAARQQATQEQYRLAEDATSWLRAKRKLEKGDKLAQEMTLADLQAEIGKRQSLLDMQDAQGESLAVLKEKMNVVVTEIEALSHKLNDAILRRDNVRVEVAAKREKWEAALDNMVDHSSTTFMKMFKQLKCNGSVCVSKPDPLAVGTWGLDLFVAFREHEEPQRLTRNRQSGGERSVTTAIFLMSLQSMARAPFRVLDEINQGMDRNNETKTMAFIVDHSCNGSQEGKPQQYFVVTPKLLFDMPYHQRMSVNFIISSDKIERPMDLPLPSIRKQDLFALLEDEAESNGEEESADEDEG